MKKTVLTLIVSFCMVSGLHAQLAIDWQKSLGGTAHEFGSDVQATPDGGCIIVGSSESFDGDVTGNHGGGDGWLVKLDVDGNIEWDRTVGGSLSDGLNGVALTADGGYIAVGTTSSDDGDVIGFHGGFFGNNIWVVKFDSLGNIEWNNCYGGTGNEYGRRISQTSDGGYLFCGGTSSTDGDVTGFHPDPTNPFSFFSDIWVVKINSTGVLQWQKCLGGSKNEVSADCRETPDGGYLVTGTTWGSYDGDVIGNTDTVSTNSTPFAVWIVKMDATQNIVWQDTYGGSGWDEAKGPMILENGGYTFLGFTNSQDGDVIGYHGDSTSLGNDFWLVHLDTVGAIQWQKCFGADSSYILNGAGVVKTQSGGYAMAAEILIGDTDFPGYHANPVSTLSADYALVVSDSARNSLWQHCYGSYLNDAPRSITEAADGGFIIVGNSAGNDGDVSGHHGPLNTDDIWVLKLAQVPAGVQSPVNTIHTFKVFPNPVSNNAKIAFYLPASNNVTVTIYDMSGKVVKTLLNENLTSGYHELNWDCSYQDQQPVSNGIFTVRIAAGGYAAHSKVTVIR